MKWIHLEEEYFPAEHITLISPRDIVDRESGEVHKTYHIKFYNMMDLEIEAVFDTSEERDRKLLEIMDFLVCDDRKIFRFA